MQASSTRIVRPAQNISGALRLPGDKSISHRYAMLAAFAEGTSRISNYATGQDCASTLACVAALGAEVVRGEDGALSITGVNGAFRAPEAPLDCGNSGSTMRMLSGLLAGRPHTFTLTGDASLSRRPMQRVAAPLREMGAQVSLADGHAPLVITGAELRGISYKPAVASAQVKSAVLFAALQAQGDTTVHENVRTRDHGELALRAFGAEVTRTLSAVSLRGPQRLTAAELTVPGDISSAAFVLAAALLFPGSSVTLDGVGMNPTRAGILDVMVSLGLRFHVLSLEEQHHELTGTLHVEGPANGPLGAEISGALAAQLIDELPVLAAIAPYSRDGIRIRDAAELRVKESDRLALVAKNLRAMGVECTEYADGLDVPGGQHPHGAEIDSGGDHRIAMAFSIAALRAEDETAIIGADCTAVSFPEFYEMLEELAVSR